MLTNRRLWIFGDGVARMIGEILEGIYWIILFKWIADDDDE